MFQAQQTTALSGRPGPARPGEESWPRSVHASPGGHGPGAPPSTSRPFEKDPADPLQKNVTGKNNPGDVLTTHSFLFRVLSSHLLSCRGGSMLFLKQVSPSP